MTGEPNRFGWNSLEQDPRFEDWETWPGAVLLDDEITHYSTHKYSTN